MEIQIWEPSIYVGLRRINLMASEYIRIISTEVHSHDKL